jgi:predicted nucleic acid-binding Zn ribbon protein
MPTYLYLCEPQSKEFEEVHSISIVLETCPECEKNNLPSHKPKRLICSATPGTVELTGNDLTDKIKADTAKLKKDMGKSEKMYANMLGDDKYHQLQTRMDRQKRR